VALSPELFKRLSRLNRPLLKEELRTGDQVASAPRRDPFSVEPIDPTLRLETVLPGRECRTRLGRYYRVSRGAEALWPSARPEGADGGAWPDGPGFVAAYCGAVGGSACAVRPDDLHESLRPLVLADRARITYLDVETCGLAGEPVFLVGLMRLRPVRGERGGLAVDQFLARDYSEEGPMLEAVWRELAETECLVTFNGRSFDLPMIEARSAVCGLFDCPAVSAHVDLLHEARRRWRRELPNCRLQTLEREVCGRRRMGDIPGCDIPAAYNEFVRAHQEADARRRAVSVRRLQTILYHNGLDLVTMAELVLRILSGRF
jgi:uncharacterized protein YprB with RNaseH-like and TPR domain